MMPFDNEKQIIFQDPFFYNNVNILYLIKFE